MPESSRRFRNLKFRVQVRRLLVMGALVLFGAVLGVLGWAYTLGGDIYEYQDSVDGVHLPPVDAVVVLAGGRGRIAEAGDVWYRYWEQSRTPVRGAGTTPDANQPPVFYVSGMGHQSNWKVFARQLRRGVLEVIKPENVVLETESTNTEGNARWLARYGEQRGWTRVLLVTSRYHMRRAHFIFEHVLREANPTDPIEIETLSVYQEPFEPGEWRSGIHGIEVTMTEYFKWVYYRDLWRTASGS